MTSLPLDVKAKTFIWITTSIEGFHKYPDAPEGVEFLKYEHRHIFHIKVWIEVFHDDRDIEFILFKRYINSLLTNNQMDYKSCEMMSDDLYLQICEKYPFRDVGIEISEDGENGSLKQYICKPLQSIRTGGPY
jgi:hypothetical protein